MKMWFTDYQMDICSIITKRLNLIWQSLCIFLITTLIWGLTAVPACAGPAIFLNGEEMEFEADPIIVEGRTLVPLRAIFEEIGADVTWDQETLTVSPKKGI